MQVEGELYRMPAGFYTNLEQSFGLPILAMRNWDRLQVKDPALLLRSPYKQLKRAIEQQPGEKTKPFWRVYGPEGLGKSTLLMQLLASINCGPVMYVPNPRRWTDGYYAYEPIATKDSNENSAKTKKVCYAQPTLQEEIIKAFNGYNGLNVDTLERALKESKVFLIDDSQVFLRKKTAYHDPSGKVIKPAQLSVLSAFLQILTNETNRPVIAAESTEMNRRYLLSTSIKSESDENSNLMMMSRMDLQETRQLLLYYKECLHLLHPPHDITAPKLNSYAAQWVGHRQFIADGLPLQLLKTALMENLRVFTIQALK